MWPFFDFQYGFRSSRSTADLLTVVLVELLGILIGLGQRELYHLIYPRLLTGFGMLSFFTNLSLMEFQVRYLVLFLLSSVIDSFEWFWMANLHKNMQTPFSRLHFLMMLSVILLSMPLILLTILSVIRYLICSSN